VRAKTARFLNVIGILFVLLLAGCNPASIVKRVTSPQDESAARNYVDLLRQDQFASIEKDMDPSLDDGNVRGMLVSMAAMFPAQQPASVKVVGMDVFHGTSSTTTNITLEYEFPAKWLLANVATIRTDGVATIVGFHVYQIGDSLEHRNRFTLVGKSVEQYATLLADILSQGLSFYAFVVCLRTKMGRGKWFWSVVCLLGVGQFGVDWTTGQINFNLWAVHLPPGGETAAPYGPWVVYVALPLGAVLFLSLRDRGYWRSQAITPVSNPESMPGQ
jgi:hypothetical protein